MEAAALSPADKIAIAAMFIALLAMVATFWQAALARRHNRLAVRPLLIRSLHRDFGPHGLTYTIGIVNVGVGPALVKNCYLREKGNLLPRLGEEHPVRALVRAALGDKVPYSLDRCGLPAVNGAIAPQTQLVVFELHFPTVTERSSPVLDDLARVFCLVVEYESLYEEQRTLTVTTE